MANLNKIVYLSEEQKNTLFTTGSVTANGTTITYNPNDLYITPPAYDATPTENSSNLITSGAVYQALNGLGEGTVTSITPGNGLINGTSGSSQAAITSSGTISLANITRTDNTSTASPAHAGTFTAIDSVTTDAYGRVTAVNTKTVTLPSDNNTDILVKQTAKTDNINYKILTTTSASPTSGNAAEAGYGANLTYNPSSNILATGNLNLTGELDVTGNAYLRNETSIDSLTAGSILVNGAANFVQLPTVPTAAAGTKTTQIATTEFVNQAFAANDAMVFKGTLGADGTTQTVPANSYLKGWTYKVATAGIYAGEYCEVGDILIAINDGPASGASIINNDWAKVQGNIDGAVTGPSGAVNNHVAVFDGTTGKIIKDSGFTIEKNVPSNAVFTDTTYTFASGDANGQIKVTPSEGTAQNIDVTGLGDAAFYDIVPIEHGGTGNAYGYIRTGAQENSIIGEYATAEGDSTIASGESSHAEGKGNIAAGTYSHAEGLYSVAPSYLSHTEGYGTRALGKYSHTEGQSSSLPGIASAGITITGNANATTYSYTGTLKYSGMSTNPHNYCYMISSTYTNDMPIALLEEYDTENHTIKFDKTLSSTAITDVQLYYLNITNMNVAYGEASHVEGKTNKALGTASHAEGSNNTIMSDGIYAHVEGYHTIASENSSHAEGYYTTASGGRSHAEGYQTTASGSVTHAEGYNTIASGAGAHAQNVNTTASGDRSHAEGYYSTASGNSAHAEGQSLASGNYSHSESQSIASGISSHAEGIVTYFTSFPISGTAGATTYERSDGGTLNDTVIGRYITTSSDYTNLAPTDPLVFKILSVNLEATPNKTLTVDRTMGALNGVTAYLIQYPEAAGDGSHVEGEGTQASGRDSHAEGEGTTASGIHSHAEGSNTKATGMNSHAEGTSNTAKGINSHAEGLNTIAARRSQHTFGEYNIEDTQGSNEGSKGQYIEIVGNGTNVTHSNARTLDWNGNEVLAGKLTVGSVPTNNMDVTTKQYVDDLVSTTSENYLPLTGGTMTGIIQPNGTKTIDFGANDKRWKNIYADKIITGCYVNNVLQINTSPSGTLTEVLIKTNIPWVGSKMHKIHLYGHKYPETFIDMDIWWYNFGSSKFYEPIYIDRNNTNLISDIKLCFYDYEEEIPHIGIILTSANMYGLYLKIDYIHNTSQIDAGGDFSSNWTYELNTSSDTTLIPTATEAYVKSVTKKFIYTSQKTAAANITTTTNAIAYYTNTTGTFGSKASANGALYATSANGTLQWGTLPVTQGGTGQTSIANIQAGKDGSGNTITSTYLTKAVGVTAVTWDNTNKKLMQTINGSTTDIVIPYWANLKLNNAASYNITPEMATIKLNGNTSASAASTKNVTLQYDASLEVLNFVFA